MTSMDNTIAGLLMVFALLQSQFTRYREIQPSLMQERSGIDEWSTRRIADVLHLETVNLTEIEERSVELEQQLRMTLIEIERSGSQRSRRRWRRDVIKLQHHLEKLQKKLRDAIGIQKRSPKYPSWRRPTMKDNKLMNQTSEIYGRLFNSVPDMSSLSEDEALDNDSLWKSKSEDRRIYFKDPMKEILENFENDLYILNTRIMGVKAIYLPYPFLARYTLPGPPRYRREETDQNTTGTTISGNPGTTATHRSTNPGTTNSRLSTASRTTGTRRSTASGTTRSHLSTASGTTRSHLSTASGTAGTRRSTASGTTRSHLSTVSGTTGTHLFTAVGTAGTCASDAPSGSQSLYVVDFSTAIYKMIAVNCAIILFFL